MKTRRFRLSVFTAVAVLSVVAHSFSQNSMDTSSFIGMKLKADDGVLILKDDSPEAKYLEGNVDALFIAKDPAENLHIKADRIDFVYESDEDEDTQVDGEEKRKQPILLNLTGNIVVTSRGTQLTSDKAEIDLVAQTVRCVSRAEFSREDGSTGETDGFVYNFETGIFDFDSLQVEVLF